MSYTTYKLKISSYSEKAHLIRDLREITLFLYFPDMTTVKGDFHKTISYNSCSLIILYCSREKNGYISSNLLTDVERRGFSFRRILETH